MRSPFTMVAIPIDGGLDLQSADGSRPAGKVAELRNMRTIGIGRVEPRRAATSVLASLAGEVSAIARFPFFANNTDQTGAIAAIWADNAVTLHKITPAIALGDEIDDLDSSWGTVSERPSVSWAVLGTKLFLCGRAGATKLALMYFDASENTLFTPEFDFDGDYGDDEGDKGKMRPRCIAEYNNFIFVAGYGTETDVDRPELVRFSYLGLVTDPEGAGDAGLDTDEEEIVSGSSSLFDREDYFMVGQRGKPVIAMAPAMGRLLFLTSGGVHHLFGYDRKSFTLEQLEKVRGITTAQSLILANGTAYWWDDLVGPVVYNGGGVEEFGDEILDIVNAVLPDQVVGEHDPDEHEVRWYYPYLSGSRSVRWNYRTKQWSEGEHPFMPRSAGQVSKTSTNVTLGDPGTTPPPVSLTAPSSIAVTGVTAGGGLASWTNGSKGAGVQTEIFVDDVRIATLDTGSATNSSYQLSGLLPSTAYTLKLRHREGGVLSQFGTKDFTTGASSTDPEPPVDLDAEAVSGGYFGVFLEWHGGESGTSTNIYRSTESGDYGSPIWSTGPGETSWFDQDVDEDTTYYYVVAAFRPDDPSFESQKSDEVSVETALG